MILIIDIPLLFLKKTKDIVRNKFDDFDSKLNEYLPKKNKIYYFVNYLSYKKVAFKANNFLNRYCFSDFNIDEKSKFGEVFKNKYFIEIKENAALGKHVVKLEKKFDWLNVYRDSKPANNFKPTFFKSHSFSIPEQGLFKDLGLEKAEEIHKEQFGSRVRLKVFEFDWPSVFPEVSGGAKKFQEFSVNPSGISREQATIKNINHGCQTLGVLLSKGKYLGVGICPKVNLYLNSINVSSFPKNHFVEDDDFIKSDMPKVVLFENQTGDYFPIIKDPYINRYLNELVAAGITIVIPAGNGGHDIGDLKTNAIVVGATTFKLDKPTKKRITKNYGKSVSTYAWGENIHTTVFDENNTYTFGFHSETSGASAAIAGVCVAIQDAMMKKYQKALTPASLKKLLTNNIPINGYYKTPDLGEIIEKIYSQDNYEEIEKWIDSL